MLNIVQIRFLVFIFICLGTRLGIAHYAKNASEEVLNNMGKLAIIPAVGIIYIYIFGSKTADGQLSWAGEDNVWWNSLRPIHGIIYALFAIMAIKGNTNAYKMLQLDSIVGLIAFINYLYSSGKINKLLEF